ncbi:PIG-L family-containing protein (plasmid) [Gordonia polyisoprenivorans VH2]|uniref:PIG-L family-containing protein n=2 Tax=Gordonia polyisoprenivorans TaxID=84595 RepID=H6N576_GORPV|nr:MULTISPECIES: PIG-L family deacetylase [Gordonia]AFA76121.1 PIG-L family-containing protein [Gordonia polyisoprenivorans VH2]MBE7194555.1 PIG-L family deacetylase [Gordonia polyisoprenivorans]MDF3283297.1 PIG-L family deacetylase [Gordonia sp. N1V]NKY04152.1 GlcNAc-PI de-N-acetylase [Gordonia polyisoprenivorans]QUD84897.1 PIG-L family deacetylase [Gordonia polyisoprenivorans]
MTVPRMMLVHAHPDDESLWTGGTIARHVELGGDVSVVTATWATGTSRHGELRNALTELGVTREPIMLGFADDGVPVSAPGAKRFCDVSFDKQVRILVGHIRRLRPEILLTYDPVGIYGHRDHVHAHRLALAAADAAGASMLHRSTGPAWRIRSVYMATIADWMIEDVVDDFFPTISRYALPGTPPSGIDLELDVSAWVKQKAAAVASHRSEVERSQMISSLMNLPRERRDRLFGTECYIRRDLVRGGVDL